MDDEQQRRQATRAPGPGSGSVPVIASLLERVQRLFRRQRTEIRTLNNQRNADANWEQQRMALVLRHQEQRRGDRDAVIRSRSDLEAELRNQYLRRSIGTDPATRQDLNVGHVSDSTELTQAMDQYSADHRYSGLPPLARQEYELMKERHLEESYRCIMSDVTDGDDLPQSFDEFLNLTARHSAELAAHEARWFPSAAAAPAGAPAAAVGRTHAQAMDVDVDVDSKQETEEERRRLHHYREYCRRLAERAPHAERSLTTAPSLDRHLCRATDYPVSMPDQLIGVPPDNPVWVAWTNRLTSDAAEDYSVDALLFCECIWDEIELAYPRLTRTRPNSAVLSVHLRALRTALLQDEAVAAHMDFMVLHAAMRFTRSVVHAAGRLMRNMARDMTVVMNVLYCDPTEPFVASSLNWIAPARYRATESAPPPLERMRQSIVWYNPGIGFRQQQPRAQPLWCLPLASSASVRAARMWDLPGTVEPNQRREAEEECIRILRRFVMHPLGQDATPPQLLHMLVRLQEGNNLIYQDIAATLLHPFVDQALADPAAVQGYRRLVDGITVLFETVRRMMGLRESERVEAKHPRQADDPAFAAAAAVSAVVVPARDLGELHIDSRKPRRNEAVLNLMTRAMNQETREVFRVRALEARDVYDFIHLHHMINPCVQLTYSQERQQLTAQAIHPLLCASTKQAQLNGDFRFEEDVKSVVIDARQGGSDDLKCPLCYDMLVGVLTTSCGHSMCASCVGNWFSAGGHRRDVELRCPVCRTHPVTLTRNRALEGVIKTMASIKRRRPNPEPDAGAPAS